VYSRKCLPSKITRIDKEDPRGDGNSSPLAAPSRTRAEWRTVVAGSAQKLGLVFLAPCWISAGYRLCYNASRGHLIYGSKFLLRPAPSSVADATPRVLDQSSRIADLISEMNKGPILDDEGDPNLSSRARHVIQTLRRLTRDHDPHLERLMVVQL